MIMKIRALATISILGLITGCTTINSTSFSDMSSAYREVVESYSNDNILLNIVRSSKNMPLSFLDIPSVIGTGNVLANAGVTSYQAGVPSGAAPPTSTTANVGLAVNNGFTFTQASLDNAQFMQSFLKEIPLSVLGLKGTERLLPRAVSYTLLIESIELRSDNSIVHRFNNDPLDPNYQEFQNLLYLLIESGLTVENKPLKTPLGPPIDKNLLTKSFDSWGSSTIDNLAKGTISFDKTNLGGKDAYQLVRNDSRARVCVNEARAKELLGNLLSAEAYCMDSPKYPKADLSYANAIKSFSASYPKAKNMELVIGIRSPGNVFDFLGSVLNAQFMGDGSKMVMIKPSRSVFDSYNERYQNNLPFFKVYKNESIKNSVATVKYKGVTYSIADDDGSYSKDVMEFMSTLVTVAKIPGAIPPSPAVIVR
ncbi:hypothetical protein AOC19_04230 [Polynucleobacter asymbioticus]|uniref:hypothetical protein n=1 Tax=Polynucleobacter asymbioticus TaxID=576611 RepID=UPI001BFD0FFB|nr:hypothetical protein [Polynucleobacter asymbioticus]QWD86073.1 hypothetical protein AOC19_04230 [Polynucleobacter asymbioticus]